MSGFAALTDDVFARLESLLAEMSTCVLPDDVPRLVQIDIAFHTLLIDGSDAPKVHELWEGLNGKMSVLFLTALEHRQASIDDVVAFHRDLLNGLRTGDLVRAQSAIVDHYLGVSDFRRADGYGDHIPPMVRLVTASLPEPSDDDRA